MTASRGRTVRKKGMKSEIPITRDQIVDAAFALIESKGASEFSMRSLATELGVFPAAVYWHVGDRAHLLGLVNERWVAEIVVPPLGDDWYQWLRDGAWAYRRAAHRHPNIARMMTVERERNTDTLTIPDAIVGMLESIGFDDDLVHAYNACMVVVQGFVVMELAARPDADSPGYESAESDLRSLDPQRFPNITRNFDHLADRAMSVRWSDGAEAPLDESFDYLLDLLFLGLRAKLGPRERPVPSPRPISR